MPSITKNAARVLATLLAACLYCTQATAHNGKIAYAYPLGPVKIDGDFSDWPQNTTQYAINTGMSDTKPRDEADFSGFFQVGYRLGNQSLYIALTITDDDFIQDTTENVRWNTQDGLELNIDARHLPGRSGVASFMYSQKLRNLNKAYFDPFSQNASWDIMEVVMLQKGNTRYYEWRINMGNQLAVGKAIGLDVMVFDRDTDRTFTFTGWGSGGSKYNNPNSLGDIVPLPAHATLAAVSGTIAWDKPVKEKLPRFIRITSEKNKACWLQAAVDSNGRYEATLPAGKYRLTLPGTYYHSGDKVYATTQKTPVVVNAKGGNPTATPTLLISSTTVPDLLPAKGILHDWTPATARQVDQFIETYQQYDNIPGVSLALIKDGRVVYHKTYGLSNSFTGKKVDSLTLFEAASITKPVFAFAVQRLAERGSIDLDKPLYEYLPYKDIEHDERYKLITGKHVLTHQTGFPNWRWNNPDNKLNIKFTPGTSYGYSGEGFEYLKLVVEKITGKKVEQVLQEEVIEPIGLYHTFFSRNDSLRRMVANGHFDGMPVHDELPDAPGMAYSMHTEALVFTRFMRYLLEQKGLTPQSYERMFQKQTDYTFDSTDEKPKMPVYMGMSLEIRETPFGKTFGHGGNNGDFKCQFEVYKDLKMGYVIFTNSNTSDYLLEAMRQLLVDGKQ